MTAVVETECAHCARRLRIETDGRTRHRADEGARPLVFAPLVSFRRWPDPSIIDGF